MRTLLSSIAALAVASLSIPADAAGQGVAENAAVQLLEDAGKLIRANKPGEAIVVLDGLISAKEAEPKTKTVQVYCARTPEETLIYMMGAATQKLSAVAVEPTWCDAIFLKGFALVDLGQHQEARKWIEKAVAMAPHNAHYKAELAESYKTERNWEKAYALFEQAAEDARTYSPEDSKTRELGRGLRGMGFALIEMGRLDEARKLFEEALKLDHNDAKAKNELQYISEQEAKRAVN